MARFIGQELAVRVFTSLVSALLILSIYVALRCLRCLRCRAWDSALFSLLALSSSAFLFWGSIPETYALGSTTMVLSVAFVAWMDRGPAPLWSGVIVSASTLAITTTNWMAGLLATLLNRGIKDFVYITLAALGLVSLFWGGE